MSHKEPPILNHIDQQTNQLTKTLISWSEINSGSTNTKGLLKQATTIVNLFEKKLKIKCKKIKLPDIISKSNPAITQDIQTGPLLIFEKNINPKLPTILLSGHYDTVFCEDNHFQKTKKLQRDILNGPGVADMKGGLLVMLSALEAFEKTDLSHKINWIVMLNPDEEIGSISSKVHLENHAKKIIKANKNSVGLVYEPSLTPDGTLAGARSGSGSFRIHAQGKSTHAGRDLFGGRNAIIALAEVATRLHKLSKKDNSLLVNIARFSADSPLNQVPDAATCALNIRIKSKADLDFFKVKLHEILKKVESESQCKLSYSGSISRPPKPLDKKQEKLFNLVKECGKELNMDINWKSAGGVCDGNNLASCGLPVVDTLGVRGGCIHSDKEFVHLNSLAERAKLSTLILYKLAQKA
jgi:glutamate carboxypeptidase